MHCAKLCGQGCTSAQFRRGTGAKNWIIFCRTVFIPILEKQRSKNITYFLVQQFGGTYSYFSLVQNSKITFAQFRRGTGAKKWIIFCRTDFIPILGKGRKRQHFMIFFGTQFGETYFYFGFEEAYFCPISEGHGSKITYFISVTQFFLFHKILNKISKILQTNLTMWNMWPKFTFHGIESFQTMNISPYCVEPPMCRSWIKITFQKNPCNEKKMKFGLEKSKYRFVTNSWLLCKM